MADQNETETCYICKKPVDPEDEGVELVEYHGPGRSSEWYYVHIRHQGVAELHEEQAGARRQRAAADEGGE